MPVTTKQVVNYIKNNVDIISKIPHDPVLSLVADETDEEVSETTGEEAKEILETAAEEAEKVETDHNSKRLVILTEKLKLSEEKAKDFISKSPTDLKLEEVSEERIPSAIDSVWSQLNKIDKNIALKLLQFEETGIGRGEKFLEYCFKDVEISGGNASFDITAGSQMFEMKSYEKPGDIRLGTEGTVTGFPEYNMMFSIYDAIYRITELNENSMKTLLQMLNNIDQKKQYTAKEIKDQILPNKKFKDEKEKEEVEKLPISLRRGEISTTNLKMLDKPIRFFGEIASKLHKNKFEYMKIVSKDEIYPILSINDQDLNNISVKVSGKISVKDEIDVISVVHELFMLLKKVKLINEAGDFDSKKSFRDEMVEKINEKINTEFSKHPMIILRSFKKDGKQVPVDTEKACVGIFRKFALHRTTQGKIKVNAIG